jgi:hypothetical protein
MEGLAAIVRGRAVWSYGLAKNIQDATCVEAQLVVSVLDGLVLQGRVASQPHRVEHFVCCVVSRYSAFILLLPPKGEDLFEHCRALLLLPVDIPEMEIAIGVLQFDLLCICRMDPDVLLSEALGHGGGG